MAACRALLGGGRAAPQGGLHRWRRMPGAGPDDSWTVWVGSIPLALATAVVGGDSSGDGSARAVAGAAVAGAAAAAAANDNEEEAVQLSRDEGRITRVVGGGGHQRQQASAADHDTRPEVVRLLERRFGPVLHAVVRIKPATHVGAKGDRRERDRRSWALVTFGEEDSMWCSCCLLP